MDGSPGTLTLETRLVAHPNVAAAEVDGEVVLLAPHTGQYYSLDGAGRRAWQLLASPGTPRGIAAILVQEFDVEPSRCEADLLSLLADLRAEGLVVAAE
jgi:hypothetical protein